ITGHHQVDFRAHGDAVLIEAVRRRVRGMLGHQREVTVELGDAARRVAGGAAHHGHEEAALRQRVEFVRYRGQWRIGGGDELVPGRARRALPLALLSVLLPGGCGGNGQQHAETEKSHRGGRYPTRYPGLAHVRGLRFVRGTIRARLLGSPWRKLIFFSSISCELASWLPATNFGNTAWIRGPACCFVTASASS